MAVSIYSKFESALLKAVKKRYSEGNPDAIYGDTRKLAEQFMIEFSIADAERKKVERDVMKEWVGKNSKTTNTGSQEGKLGQSSGINSFATMAGKLNRDVKRVVDRGLRSNYKLDQIEALIKRATSHGKHQSRTIARTAKLGKIRADYITESLRLGYEYFRYSGPSSDRDFCSIHINKIYHISEILKLDNKQGLLVLIYMGGWNCRHRWERVAVKKIQNVYIDNQWQAKFEKHLNSNENKEVEKLNIEKDVAVKMAALNYNIELNPAYQNNKKGQVDIIINGKQAEIKSTKSKAGTIENAIKSKDGMSNRQSDFYVVNLREPITQEEKNRLIGKVNKFKKSYPELVVYLLHNYLSQPFVEVI